MTNSLLLVRVIDAPRALSLASVEEAGWQTAVHAFADLAGLDERLQHQRPDLLLLQLGPTGLPAAELIQTAGDRQLPIILLAEPDQEEEALRLLSAGARDYVRTDRLARLLPICQRELATARQRADLLEHKTRLQAVWDHAADGILSIDDKGVIFSLNPAAARIFAREPAQVIGQTIRLLIPRPYLREHESYRAGSPLKFGREVVGQRADGSPIPLELSIGESAAPGRQRLFVAIVRDISQRAQSEAALNESREQLRNLAARLVHVREEERTRISREVHDELGQALTGVKMDLAWLHSKLPDSLSDLRRRAEATLQLIDQTIQTVREIATELRPGVLDNLGLVAAIEWQSQEFQRRTGISCSCSLGVDPVELDPDLATGLFRIFQETLTNVIRHADASKVEVALQHQDQALCLEVCDNGRGISPAQQADSSSLGLLGMRERAQQLGGQFTIAGAAGQGTQVQVQVPMRRRSTSASSAA